MIRLLQLLIWGHVHKWKRTRNVDIYSHDYEGVRSEMPTGRIAECECETCGVPKAFSLYRGGKVCRLPIFM